MRDHLVRWDQKYKKRGLVIIEIDGGRYETLEKVREIVREKKIKHAVLWDEDCQNHQNYGVDVWPVAYLIGVDGLVVWEGNPFMALHRPKRHQKLKSVIENQLKLIKPSNRNPEKLSQSAISDQQSAISLKNLSFVSLKV